MRFQNACNGEGPALPFCGTIDPCNSTRPERGGEWIKKILKEFKGTWTKVYERYRYQSGDHDAEDPVAEFMKFFGGDTIALYAFIVFDHSDAMVGLLGKSVARSPSVTQEFKEKIRSMVTVLRL